MINSMAINMALEIIIEDLEQESGEKIELNYFSFAQAVARFNKKGKTKRESRKPEFKDAYEIRDKQKPPGTFTCSNEDHQG
jgi:nucleoid DNA-binding protein